MTITTDAGTALAKTDGDRRSAREGDAEEDAAEEGTAKEVVAIESFE